MHVPNLRLPSWLGTSHYPSHPTDVTCLSLSNFWTILKKEMREQSVSNDRPPTAETPAQMRTRGKILREIASESRNEVAKRLREFADDLDAKAEALDKQEGS